MIKAKGRGKLKVQAMIRAWNFKLEKRVRT